MKFRIDWQKFKDDPLSAERIVIYLAALGGVYLYLSTDPYKMIYHFVWSTMYPIIFPPYILVGGSKVLDGIRRFSNEPIDNSWRLIHTGIMLWTMFLYIICPAIFVWGIRLRHKYISEQLSGKFRSFIGMAVAFGGFFVILNVYSLILIPISLSTTYNMESTNKQSRNRDSIFLDIAAAGNKAREVYFLPKELGGAEANWMGFEIDNPRAIQVDDIKIVKPILEFIATPEFPVKPAKIFLEVIKKDSLILWGIIDHKGFKEHFANKDGRVGLIQVRTIVTPDRIISLAQN